MSAWCGSAAARGRSAAASNPSNDIDAANVVMRSGIEVWQIPQPVYRLMPVGYAELMERVHDKGRIGKYLVEQLMAWNERMVPYPIEHRSLGDSPAIGVIMYPECGLCSWRLVPDFNREMNYLHNGMHRAIKVYQLIHCRFIHEDFFAKLAMFARGDLTRDTLLMPLVLISGQTRRINHGNHARAGSGRSATGDAKKCLSPKASSGLPRWSALFVG